MWGWLVKFHAHPSLGMAVDNFILCVKNVHETFLHIF